ncbi:MAG TPA: M20/M25/M40 family metallo-hydrolase [Thermoplasmata archaeon]|nr:M20/M25/M40 family metallo-hydrolase [Thermoplasmata archaeon]
MADLHELPATDPLGDPDATELLRDLVAIHPSNLEDPVRGRYEKPRYGAAIARIERAARAWGLSTRRYDPVDDGPRGADLRGIPRPNLIVDLPGRGAERVLVLAHYDVVPVPEEQLGRWRSDPKVLTPRADGRWYGRGANDDLGSGVVGTLLAMKRLAAGPPPPRSVRLLVCCDEETGGEGGIESLKARDAARPAGDPDRFLVGDVALIPDGSPHAIPASSGVAFLDGSFSEPVPLAAALRFGQRLVAMHDAVARQRSRYPSADFPEFGAPAPVLTGRATVTRIDLGPAEPSATAARVIAAHAETDAANFIPESVTLAIAGPAEARRALIDHLGGGLPPGYRFQPATHTALVAPPGADLVQIVGEGGHGGSPHRARNPVPVALDALASAVRAGLLDATARAPTTYAVDLRMIPEATQAEGLDPELASVRRWAATECPTAHLDAPPHRLRTGYALPLDDPSVGRLARLLAETLGAHGVFGEYGGTDASSLAGLKTPRGAPLPAIVFGSMDRPSRIHDAEESVDPRLLAGVVETIRRFVLDA